MTSFALSANDSFTGFNAFANMNRAPRRSFAARLASLQARAEATDLAPAGNLALRVAIAAAPVGALAWLFVAV